VNRLARTVRLAGAAVATGLFASAITPGPALGSAVVGIDEFETIAHVDVVAAGDSADADHGVIIEPIVDSSRSYRVRGDTFGAPSVEENTVECAGNPVLNDVVCNAIVADRSRYAIGVTMGDGDDRVALFEQALTDGPFGVLVAAPRFCPVPELEGLARPVITGTIRAGGGNDKLRIVTVFRSSVCPGGFTDITHLVMRFLAEGGGGIDTLTGGVLGDMLNGGDAADELEGRGGPDAFNGGPGADTLKARDGVRDSSIRCGPGTDTAVLDSQDVLIPPDPDPPFGRPDPGSACETVDRTPLDDGPPGRALRQRLRVARGGRVAVKVACPRAARVACRGVLTLRDPRSNRVLARGRYRVRLGRKATISLRARRRLPRRVAAEMNEQGVSERGPRFSSRLLRVRG
jgi:hypothetical protein